MLAQTKEALFSFSLFPLMNLIQMSSWSRILTTPRSTVLQAAKNFAYCFFMVFSDSGSKTQRPSKNCLD